MEITVEDAATNFDDIVELLVAGKVGTVVLTLDGRPAVRLDPIAPDVPVADSE